MSDPRLPPAGWYDDGRGARRWWSGRDWTDHVVDPVTGERRVLPLPRTPEAATSSETTAATGATAPEPDRAVATDTVGAALVPGDYRCPYCRRTSTLGRRGECLSCGAHARVQEIVSDSGWEELPGAEDMAHIQLGRSSVQIAGNFVPIAEFSLVASDTIWFPHHKLTYADEQVVLGRFADGNGFLNRMRAGMPTALMTATGAGRIALSDNHLGELVALPLEDGAGYWVRDHVFLAATSAVAYRPHRNSLWLKFRKSSGNDTEYEVEYPLGVWDELFFAQGGPGLLLLHSPGNTMFRDLAAGETIRIQPQSLLYRDLSVTPYLVAEYPSTAGWRGWFTTQNFENRHLWLSLTGPGRVAISSKYEKEHAHPYPIVDGTVQFHRW